MTYALIESDKDVSTLTSVDQEVLTLKEALTELMNGSVLVINEYEQSTGADTFVRLNLALEKPITEITYNIQEPVWQRFPVPVNALSLYSTYLYDPSLYGTLSLRVGDVVKYRDKDGIIQASIIQKVFLDSDNLQYFVLSNSDKVYLLSYVPEVNTDTSASDISGVTSVLAPVADPTKDSHQVAVQDYQTKVWVLL